MNAPRTLGSYFVTGKRDNGETFAKCTDDAPQWLRDAIMTAHDSDLPNDWVYAECRAACEAIDEGSLGANDDDDGRDDGRDHADGRVDVYTRALFMWAADMCLTDTFASAEQDAEDGAGTLEGTTVQQLTVIQYYAIRRIAAIMCEAYHAAKEAAE